MRVLRRRGMLRARGVGRLPTEVCVVSERSGAAPLERRSPLAQRLVRARLALGLTQEQVARRAGLRTNYVTQVETDQFRYPDPEKLAAWARALDLPYRELQPLPYALRGEDQDDEPPPPPPVVAPPVIDPDLPRYIQDALRPLVGKLPDEDVRATGRMLAGMVWKTRAELEAELGPTKYRPPDARDGDRDGTAG